MAKPSDAANDDVKHSIRMTADRLLVLPSDEVGDRKSRGGILIPATANVSPSLIASRTTPSRGTSRTGRVTMKIGQCHRYRP